MPFLCLRLEFDKNANSIDVSTYCFSYRYSLATIGVCVFCAVTSVAALFVFEEGFKMESNADLVKKGAELYYDKYIEKHRNTSDSQLLDINFKNGRTLITTPVNTNNFKSLCELCAEMTVCKEIYEERQEQRKNEKAWKENLEERRKAAILNLPTATSKIGQLIITILEFRNGMTVDDILKFKHSSISELTIDKLNEILKRLTAEGVIYEKEKRYYFLRTCTPSLFPEDPIDYTRRVFEQKGIEFEEAHAEILSTLQKLGRPALHEEELDADSVRIEWPLMDLKKAKIVRSYYKDFSETRWFFTMLGEKEDK